jgi:hypothetical protein
MINGNSTLRSARKYTRWGWHVVPIPSKKKAPVIKSWQKLYLANSDLPEHFDDDSNIGVLLGEPSGGLLDVDLDCDEAILLAPSFLPKTRKVHGRKSKRASHYWYHVETSPKPDKFCDIDGTTLLELRSTGQQTVVPPSTHPSGEHIRWEQIGSSRRLKVARLQTAVRRLAAAVLLSRHWPAQGSRNATAMALAGVLLREGWEKSTAAHFISMVSRGANDEEWKARGDLVSNTQKRLDEGEDATGIPRLRRLINPRAVDLALKWLRIHTFPVSRSRGSSQTNRWPKPLKEEAFHGLTGDIVHTIEPKTEADPAALLLQFLVAFGNSLGPHPYFDIEGAWQKTNLFCLVVGRSAKARKGTAWAHVKRILEDVDRSWTKNCLASNLSSGEGVIWAVRDPNPKKHSGAEHGRRGMEKTIVDKRLMVIQSEFASALRIQRREGNILSAILRQAWDSGKLRILTKNSPAETTGAHISVIGHITLDELRRELSETDEANGYANRFLFVCAERTKLLPLGGRVNKKVLRRLVRRLIKVKFHSRKVERLDFSSKARKLWCERYPRLTAEVPGMLGAITARAEAQVLRLAIIYALLDRSEIIKTQHLRAALAVWRYCSHSAHYIFGGALGDRVSDKLLKALRAKREGMSRTEVRNLFKRNLDAEKIARALEFLARHHLAACSTEKTEGRPIERWSAL